MAKMHVVYITDENYAMPTGVSIQSLLDNIENTNNLVVHIIAINVDEITQEKWKEITVNRASLDVVSKTMEGYREITDIVSKTSYVTQTSLIKFAIAEIFPDLNKCLYLDGDTIINGDISAVFDIDLSGMYVAAAIDMGDEKNSYGRSNFSQRIGLLDDNYFNSGVMLLNLEFMRKEKVHKRLLDYRLNGINYFMDQDAINVVFGRKKKILASKYNCISSIFDNYDFEFVNMNYFGGNFSSVEECLKSQKIIHMADKLKPWKYQMPYFSALFFKYYAKSSYSSERIYLKSPVLHLRQEIKALIKHHKDLRQKMEWRFPYGKIIMGAKVVIYGAGEVGKSYVRQIESCKYCSIVLWCDRAYTNKGKDVESPQNIPGCKYDYVVVALADENYFQDAYKYLVELGVPGEKIVKCF